MMGGPIMNTVAISCAIAVVLCAWRVVRLIWWRPKVLEKQLSQQGLKGNKYRILHGDLKEMYSMMQKAKLKPISLDDNGEVPRRVLPLLHRAFQKYGKNFIVWIGWKPRVYVMEPDVIKDIMMNTNDFTKTRKNPLLMLMLPGLVSYEGEQWVKHRKLLNPAFHLDKLKSMLPLFHFSCIEMVEKWEKMVSVKGPCELDVWPDLQTLTSDALSRTAFGSSYEEGIRIFQLVREQAKLLLELSKSVYIPGTWYLPTKNMRKMNAIEKEVRDSISGIISKRMKAIKSGEGNYDDLLGILLESNMNEVKQYGNKNHGMNINEVIEECKLFYFAGQETTSSLLVWTMVLLSKHQEWQSRARNEVFEVMGNKNLDFDALNHLKVVTMILHEVLRLYPPVTALFRQSTKEYKIDGLSLPSGVQIGLPIMLLHYDEEIWGGDAKEFKPERFSQGVLKATKNQLVYFPFGWGPRICIGQNFAMIEAKIALSMILRNFSFELSPAYVHAPCTVLTLQPQFGAHLILQKL